MSIEEVGAVGKGLFCDSSSDKHFLRTVELDAFKAPEHIIRILLKSKQCW